jgi:two-component system, NarL family, response regulator NreC
VRQIKLLLVDDHAVVRSGLRMLLQAEPDLVIVGEAETGLEGVAKAEELRPDVVLMDISMPGMSGIEATSAIKRACPATAVLALTMHEDKAYFFEMLSAGASGYVPKRAAPDELVSAIRTVFAGEVFLYPSLAKSLVQDYLEKRDSPGQQPKTSSELLTGRENQVLVLIAEGLHNREIGEKLAIRAKTVSRHRENIMSKLNLHDRVDLVKYAIEKGLISVSDQS